jgi:hypothetical protein
MPKQLGPICDRVFKLTFVNARNSIAYSKKRTVAFRSQYRYHYELAGLPVNNELKFNAKLETFYEYLVTQRGISACFERIGFWPLSEGL